MNVTTRGMNATNGMNGMNDAMNEQRERNKWNGMMDERNGMVQMNV